MMFWDNTVNVEHFETENSGVGACANIADKDESDKLNMRMTKDTSNASWFTAPGESNNCGMESLEPLN
jgi:hypothetical protein